VVLSASWAPAGLFFRLAFPPVDAHPRRARFSRPPRRGDLLLHALRPSAELPGRGEGAGTPTVDDNAASLSSFILFFSSSLCLDFPSSSVTFRRLGPPGQENRYRSTVGRRLRARASLGVCVCLSFSNSLLHISKKKKKNPSAALSPPLPPPNPRVLWPPLLRVQTIRASGPPRKPPFKARESTAKRLSGTSCSQIAYPP